MLNLSRALALLAVLAFAHPALAVSVHDEDLDEDLSGNRLAPTVLAFGLGVNTISGSTVGGDLEYFTFTIPGGAVFTQLNHTVFTSTDDLAFIAVQAGTQFSVDPGTAVPGDLLGWFHLANTSVGTDVLDDLGVGGGAIGFSPPLQSGDYVFWIQQLGPVSVGYSLDFVVAPEPGTASMLGLALAGLALLRRSR